MNKISVIRKNAENIHVRNDVHEELQWLGWGWQYKSMTWFRDKLVYSESSRLNKEWATASVNTEQIKLRL